MAGVASAETVTVTVYGPGAALDLMVPADVPVGAVAQAYAADVGAPSVPLLLTPTGAPLDYRQALADAGVGAGSTLVATFEPMPRGAPAARTPDGGTGARTTSGGRWWALAAAVAAVLSCSLASALDGGRRTAVVALLLGAAVVAVVPVGRRIADRALFAPAFAGAGGFVLAYEPGLESLPLTLAMAALLAAVTAGVGRALGAGAADLHNVWIASSLVVFALSVGCVLAGFGPQVFWSVLLLLAVFATRFIPGFAVDVPDQLLIDLERLAVTAWSARDRPRGRRGRTVVPRAGVEALLERGSMIVSGGAAAILLATVLAVPGLLATATLGVDELGARFLVFFAGGALLLAGRSYRHTLARGLLRAAGLFAWVVLSVHVLTDAERQTLALVAGVSLALACAVVAAAIATGRGWRSVWWSRRAEIGESLCGAFVIASLVVASGLFRVVWEIKR